MAVKYFGIAIFMGNAAVVGMTGAAAGNVIRASLFSVVNVVKIQKL